MKKTFGRCIALLLLACASAAWGAEIHEQIFVVGADVNTQGQITQTQVDADVTRGVANFLDVALKRWQFVPAQQNGKAATVHTFIQVKFEVIPGDAGKYTLRASYVKHGPKWDNQPPQYPADAIRKQESGMVVLLGKMDPDGRFEVSDTRAVFTNGNSRSTLKQAARTWLTDLHAVPETVNQQAVAADAHIAVHFRLNGQSHSATNPGYTTDEQKLLLDSGFKPPAGNEAFDAHQVSSVLQTQMINPVTMRL